MNTNLGDIRRGLEGHLSRPSGLPDLFPLLFGQSHHLRRAGGESSCDSGVRLKHKSGTLTRIMQISLSES